MVIAPAADRKRLSLALLALLAPPALQASHASSASSSSAAVSPTREYVDRFTPRGLSEECSNAAGPGFLAAYKDGVVKRVLCRSTGESADAARSHFGCECRAKSDCLCRGRNIRLTTSPQWAGLAVVKDESQKSGEKAQEDGTTTLAISGGCEWEAGALEMSTVWGNPLRMMALPAGEDDTCTPEGTINGTVLIWRPTELFNPYEGMHQPLMTFATLAALGVDAARARLFYASATPPTGVLVPLIEKLYGRGGRSLDASGPRKTLCISDLVVPIPGERSQDFINPYQVDQRPERCFAAPLLRGFASFMLDSFAVKQEPSRRMRITMITRARSKVHPGRFQRHMVNQPEFLQALEDAKQTGVLDPAKAHLWEKTFEGVPLGRRRSGGSMKRALFRSETLQASDSEADLSEHVNNQLDLLSSALSKGWEVVELRPEDLTIAEQLRIFANTDLLVSPHGAGLTWSMLLPQCGQVLEFCTANLLHYAHLVRYAGRNHTCRAGAERWESIKFFVDVQAEIDTVRNLEASWRACKMRADSPL
eukprot:TRINITY_DN9734_c0_g1_i2.p1 TRINITY_DN9734_c0_g1~~TRINITY_DN9734_c0_g1_i2.p1  ORF type:complete len:536 (+),score=88.16 TRINITY_DN9734_c0_g1_i2:133-1740(+)